MDVVASRLADLRGDIRNAQRQQRRRAMSRQKRDQDLELHRKVAVRIGMLCTGDTCEALHYLDQKGSKKENGRPWRPEDIVDWMRAEADEPCAVPDAVAEPWAGKEMEAARQFLLENSVYAWVREQNERKGLTPTVKTTVDRYERFAQTSSSESKSFPKTSSGRWKWGTRWATRWQVSRGQLKAGVRLPLEQRRQKATRQKGSTGARA